ncbi:hypothetical protein SAMN05428947_11481 [Mucilaginibacter sp. OK283]|jgi:hypothetical protein|nr:hypothetical protein SAMN05428947_11481 [Mucilaginibacter sp. OK283]
MKTLTKSFKAVIYGNADAIQLRNVSLALIVPALIILFIFAAHAQNGGLN